MSAKQQSADMVRRIGAAIMIAAGVIVAALVAAMPQVDLDLLMWRLSLPQLLSAATPPIGVTGRTLLALLAMAPFLALAAVLYWGGRGKAPVRRRRVTAELLSESVPVVRRADAHPDANPRRPIRAAEDLGPPLPMVTVSVTRGVPELEQPLPADLDQPLAAFDPISVPDVPREPVRSVPPLAPSPSVQEEKVPAPVPEAEPAPIAQTEEAAAAEVELRPIVAAETVPEPEPEPEPEPLADVPPMMAPREEAVRPQPESENDSLASLLERLERGARRKKAVPATRLPQAEPEPEPPAGAEPPASLDDTLVMLRRMARG